MKRIFLIVLIIFISGILSNIFFQFNVNSKIYFFLMVIYWIIAGFIYFKKIEKMVYFPFVILTFYTILNMFVQIKYADLGEIIKMHELIVWTNFGFLPLFKIFYLPEHSMEVHAYKVFGIVYFVIVNLLFYLGYFFVRKSKRNM